MNTEQPSLLPKSYRDISATYTPATKKETQGVSVIIPFRGAERLDNLRMCLAFMNNQSAMPLEVIVVEESPAPILSERTLVNRNIRLVKVLGGDKFNKSVAVNTGVLMASYNAISIHDVDLILPSTYMEEVANSLYGEYEACFFLKEIFYLWHRPTLGKIIINPNHKRADYFNGGSVNVRKDTFMSIGGMNEKFSGYGHEDCEFWTRVKSLTKLLEDRRLTSLHMNHKRPFSLSQNTALYESIVNMSMQDRLDQLRIDLAARGKRINNEETVNTNLHS